MNLTQEHANRVELYAEREKNAQSIFTGEPLTNDDLEEWKTCKTEYQRWLLSYRNGRHWRHMA